MNGGEYVDVRDLLDVFEWRECWNCGNEKRVRTDQPPWKVCHECFMGQQQTDRDTEYVTPEGYVDFRRLWYGNVSIAEAKRRYEENTAEIRERHARERARDRTVRV